MYVTCLSHVMSVSNHVTRVTSVTRVTRVTRLLHVSRPFSFGPASLGTSGQSLWQATDSWYVGVHQPFRRNRRHYLAREDTLLPMGSDDATTIASEIVRNGQQINRYSPWEKRCFKYPCKSNWHHKVGNRGTKNEMWNSKKHRLIQKQTNKQQTSSSSGFRVKAFLFIVFPLIHCDPSVANGWIRSCLLDSPTPHPLGLDTQRNFSPGHHWEAPLGTQSHHGTKMKTQKSARANEATSFN